MEILELKNTIYEINKAMKRLNGRMETIEKRIRGFEDST